MNETHRRENFNIAALVIFDCDGVLIDSEMIACRSVSAVLAEIGISLTPEDIAERYTGHTDKAMFADLEARFGQRLSPEFIDGLDLHVRHAFEAALAAMPGTEAALSAIALPKCVASSSSRERLRHTLSLTGLLRYFDPYIFSAAQVERAKPAPDLFLFAAREMHCEPQSCWVIEDSIAGVTAGVAAGMRVIGFTGGSHCRPDHSERLRQAGASEIIRHPRELPHLITRL